MLTRQNGKLPRMTLMHLYVLVVALQFFVFFIPAGIHMMVSVFGMVVLVRIFMMVHRHVMLRRFHQCWLDVSDELRHFFLVYLFIHCTF